MNHETKSTYEELSDLRYRMYVAKCGASALTYVADLDHPRDIEKWRAAMFGLSIMLFAEMERLHDDLDSCVGDVRRLVS